METVEKVYLIEVSAQYEESIGTHTIFVKARDLEEATERAIGRLAWNCGREIKICGVREVTNNG